MGFSAKERRKIRLWKAFHDGIKNEVLKCLEQGANPKDAPWWCHGDEEDWYNGSSNPLHWACVHGWVNIVQLLIEKYKFDPVASSIWVDGFTPLHYACNNGNVEVANLLIKSFGCNPNVKDSTEKRTPLYLACVKGKYEVVSLLLNINEWEIDVSVEDSDKEGKTLIHYACQYGWKDIVQLLVGQHGCEPRAMDKLGRTALHFACKYGWRDIVQSLIEEYKCEPNSRDQSGKMPLHYACENGSKNIVQLLIIQFNCEPAISDKFGMTPMHYACENGNDEVSYLLINKFQCNPNVTDSQERTPLHVAIKNGKHNVVQLMVSMDECKIHIRDSNGKTPLHYACTCENGHDEISVQKLVDRGADPNAQDSNGDTPLHVLLMTTRRPSMKIFKCLLEAPNCDPNIQNNSGSTPCHLLNTKGVYGEHVDNILVEFISHGADPNITDNHGNTLLHIACKFGCKETVQLLLKFARCDVNQKNKLGQTPLLVPCPQYNQSIVKQLIEHGANPNVVSKYGNTVLHLACEQKALYTIKYLIDTVNCDIDAKNGDGKTPLQMISATNSLPYLTVKLILHKGDCLVTDQYGNTPLHLACKQGELDIVKFFLIENKCDPNAVDRDGRTPLLVTVQECAKNGNPIIIYELLQNGAYPNAIDNDGNTPLHIACQMNAFFLLKYLIHAADPNIKNKAGLTPLQLTSDATIIRELIQHGARASVIYKNNTCSRIKQPLKPIVKVFVVGNPSVGKSTLTAALQKEISFLVSAFTPSQKITLVDKKTAGIVPHEFESKVYGYATIYDFAGQREFYGSHAALLQNVIQSSPPVFLIVVDLCESEEEITQSVLYWLTFLENQCASVNSNPHVIIIGSHADILRERGEDPGLKTKTDFLKLRISSKFVIVGFIAMDCQRFNSRDMNQLRQFLKSSCNAIRRKEIISFNAHCFYVYLVDNFKDSIAVTIEQIQAVIQAQVSFPKKEILSFIPDTINLLCKICDELNDRGHILFLKDSQAIENSWIVIDQKCLLSKVSGTIFAPEHFKQHKTITQCPCSTGVVPLSSIAKTFPDHNPKLLSKFLTCLEFCHEISDDEILQCITAQHRTCMVSEQAHYSGERYFLFPALVSLDVPTSIWSKKPEYTHHCGWVLNCSIEKPEHFFTSRFLQVLLLRIAFSFPLSKGYKLQSNPAIQRNCSIWKNGIFWGNSNGVETLVEVTSDNKAVFVLMRCSKRGILSLVQLRSQVICKVLKAVDDFCRCIETVESFIDPDETTVYPLKPISQLNLFHMINISMAVLEDKIPVTVVGPTGTIPLETLVQFEPYAGLGEYILWEIFEDQGNNSEKILDSFFSKLAKTRAKCPDSMIFISCFNPEYEVCNTVKACDILAELKTWRAGCIGTYESLREKLDEFSIFTGRNPLGVVGITERPKRSPEDDEQNDKTEDTKPLKSDKPTVKQLQVLDCGGKRVKVIESVAAQWKELATALGFEARVNNIGSDFKHDCEGAATQVLNEWLNAENHGESDLDKPITWDTLIQSLNDAGQAVIAEDLSKVLMDDSSEQAVTQTRGDVEVSAAMETSRSTHTEHFCG